MQAIPFDKEGHRGCRGLMPENTIPAMMHAIDLGVTTLEMDVHITKDSLVVLSHDPWMNPVTTTKPNGSYMDADEPRYILYNMTYDSISRFDVGYKPYPLFPQQQKLHVAKPLLTTLIDSVEAYCRQQNKHVFYNIEIKSSLSGDNVYHPGPEKYTDLLMHVLQEKGISKYAIIQSFDVRPLQYLHTKYPYMQTSLLVDGTDHRPLGEVIGSLGFTPAIYSPNYALVTDSLVQDCHQKGIRVLPWTVNDIATMKRLKAMGVDGLISDYPNLYKNL
jgi:glycerophosphoryl diester phosphodiesterase